MGGARRHAAIVLTRTLAGVWRELRWGAQVAKDRRSLVRFGADVFLYRILRLLPVSSVNRERCIRLKGNVNLNYRLNRGDIEGIREVWVEECYRLPFPMRPSTVIDLGANIGLTSIFLAHRYQCTTTIAVEPVDTNAELARRNLLENGVRGQVVEAAVGPYGGSIGFSLHRDSNRGRTGGDEHRVPMISMDNVLAMVPGGRVDLLKVDIEGGEEDLLLGEISWLDKVGSLVIEFHPPLVDQARLVEILRTAGFRYIAAGSVWPGSMDSFVRDGWRPEAQTEPAVPASSW